MYGFSCLMYLISPLLSHNISVKLDLIYFYKFLFLKRNNVDWKNISSKNSLWRFACVQLHINIFIIFLYRSSILNAITCVFELYLLCFPKISVITKLRLLSCLSPCKGGDLEIIWTMGCWCIYGVRELWHRNIIELYNIQDKLNK